MYGIRTHLANGVEVKVVVGELPALHGCFFLVSDCVENNIRIVHLIYEEC
jgi:hypothetical protein